MSGINETGRRFDATMPRRSNARKVITTATGREIRNLTMGFGVLQVVQVVQVLQVLLVVIYF
jgi:hypothetical protein